ncbi:unnamed protein product, partial [Ectocarpus sp. 8 AP-2014]
MSRVEHKQHPHQPALRYMQSKTIDKIDTKNLAWETLAVLASQRERERERAGGARARLVPGCLDITRASPIYLASHPRQRKNRHSPHGRRTQTHFHPQQQMGQTRNGRETRLFLRFFASSPPPLPTPPTMQGLSPIPSSS